ncbi:uncharacterized protein MELLADRAFT_88292 [Melampsora larici-populina 98AG31]|uniref:Amidohydrolase-related domain-containing protein n=1 Tax=Melampsora larici-populina (strain 98AG31 / pathotype 3-4-7) TaxID=747676 RepID=F4RR99_MELLP|nr:uncharacterized protein MELLADRAFT_88292 [Melampsora larici-populina 98AG31]EGG05188.1 hypothetical protein MELLADRAFT_88292 [Melampsora larici-populina 98AG31]
MTSLTNLNSGTITVLIGSFIHSISPEDLEIIKTGLIVFHSNGKIIGIEKENLTNQECNRKSDLIQRLLKKKWIQKEDVDRLRFIRLRNGEFLLPGFIDTHTHAVQYTNIGVGQQYELLDWLKNVTFLEETKYSSDGYSQRIFEKVVKRLLNSGTTTCCYFSSIHLSASKVLSQVCFNAGQRAFIGKCNMDRNETFESYKENSVEESIKDTIELIDYIRQHCVPELEKAHRTSIPDHPLKDGSLANSKCVETSLSKKEGYSTALVQPILTPRFAISCTDELLRQLGQLLQSDPSLRLQTHLSESKSEISFTKSLFPNIGTYTEIYDEFKLLTSRTILAHCIHLEQSEIDLIKKRECGLSHCPSSNFNLKSGICKVKRLLQDGIEKIGLGTDVSGGHGIGILSCIRDGMIATKALGFNDHDTPLKETHEIQNSLLSIKNLFYLATLGGAKVCNLEERIGNFIVGKEFDGIIVQTGVSFDPIEKLEDDELIRFGFEEYQDGCNPNFFIDEFQKEIQLNDLFEKFLFTGDDRNIASVFVKGKVVGGARKSLF